MIWMVLSRRQDGGTPSIHGSSMNLVLEFGDGSLPTKANFPNSPIAVPPTWAVAPRLQ
jgi:hypothetical protein